MCIIWKYISSTILSNSKSYSEYENVEGISLNSVPHMFLFELDARPKLSIATFCSQTDSCVFIFNINSH